MDFELQNPLITKLESRHVIADAMKDELSRLVRRQHRLAAGHDFEHASWRSGTCSLLLDGMAARYKLLPNGRRQITALHLPGDFVDLGNLVIDAPDYAVVTLADCRLGLVDHDHLEAMIMQSAAVTRLLWIDSFVDAAIQQERLVSMGRRSALQHLAHLVCELFLRLKVVDLTEGFAFHLPLTQADVADVLGLSIVHVNRVLKTLRNDAVMTWTNQQVTIESWARLREVAEFDPAYLAFRKPVV